MKVQFLLFAAILALANLLPHCSMSAQSLFRVPYVGNVTDQSATVMTWLDEPGTVAIQYDVDPTLSSPRQSASMTASAANDNVVMFTLDGLEASQRYYYRVVTESGAPVGRIQSFRTFAPAGIDADETIFFGSCQQSLVTDTGGVFSVAAQLGGDLFIQLGDWAYPDVRIPGYPTTDSSVRSAYALRLDTLYPFANLVLSRMPLAYVWDDHDAFGDNSDGTASPEVKRRVRDGYGRYVPSYALANSDGVWHSFVMGNVEVFMLDSRTFRSPIDAAFSGNTFAPPPGHSMLAGGGFSIPGVDQMTWFMDRVRSSTARWKVIVTQVPFNPAMAQGVVFALLAGRKDIARRFAEYWAGYPADMDSMRRLVNEGRLRNAIIVSGSVHTNMYDDGTHSLIPEFVAANLDIENTHLRDTLMQYGLNVWTAGQTGSESAVGRIRVETSPVHRLVVESFGESGAKLLEMVVAEKASGVPTTDASTGRDLRVRLRDDRLRLESDLEGGGATIRLFTINGEQVASATVWIDARGAIDWTLPNDLARGSYLGRLERAGVALPFTVTR